MSILIWHSVVLTFDYVKLQSGLIVFSNSSSDVLMVDHHMEVVL